ncbi:phosphate ABC transporter substrate-binding protein PstS [Tessaracoccus sp. ZS01]|uniref:phosphate ABC transporter substrate-binding protein PstS n=1 Tax=Tessaracoccus sp. ZS01 TaxID=1906324 RepID=UPI00096E6F62|nr:phosphate ABC transporter substrate-binding protein PstS [Tessaracoccus sp. ZS01]MCG6567781.1 phosphate ABC transporter substrate-binding protein PstS [Tessaracoccus sp. ZS01]OMG55520.1 phosphate ABC transporter substrate-binding protein PstS [Tessaracoccus sp. ZS01]
MKIRLTAAAGLSAALLLSACAANEGTTNAPAENTTAASASESAGTEETASTEAAAPASNLEGTLSGIGASAQEVAQQTWIAGFQTANEGVTINYSPEGSGAGREAFIGGGADFAGSDRAFKQEEIDENTFSQCVDKPINLPVYISPIAVVFNVEGVTDLNLDAGTLAAIFKGDITKWNDEKIAALNEGVELPDLDITAVHRSDTSGTTENFTDYLAAAAPSVWDAEKSGDWPYEGGEAAAQTQGVVSAVSGGVGTIGYVDASQAGDFSTAKLGKDGSFHGPTTEAAAAIVENSPVEDGRAENDMAIKVDREAEGYPIVLVSYLIACQDYQDDAKAELVKAYATYIASEAGQSASAERAGSAPLSAALSDEVTASIDSIQ